MRLAALLLAGYAISAGANMISVPAGLFRMGSEAVASAEVRPPQHRISLRAIIAAPCGNS
jgi:hypothetical protein